MTTSNYLKPDQRSAQILAAALKLAERQGYANITREQVGAAAGCSASLVNRYFEDMDGLRTQVVREAIRRQSLRVIAQALVNNHLAARRCPAALREKALGAGLRK